MYQKNQELVADSRWIVDAPEIDDIFRLKLRPGEREPEEAAHPLDAIIMGVNRVKVSKSQETQKSRNLHELCYEW